METSTVSTLASAISLFELQTRLFNNVIGGISDEDASKRLGEGVHTSWLVGHIVSTRHMLASLVGVQEEYAYNELFGQGKGLEEGVQYPTIAELSASWNDISAKLLNGLSNLTDEQLAADAPFQVPIGDPTFRGVLSFFAHHEAYHIGQIGISRRYLGYEAMGYK